LGLVSSFTWSPRPSLTSSKEADNEKSQFMSPKTSSISTGQEKDPLKGEIWNFYLNKFAI